MKRPWFVYVQEVLGETRLTVSPKILDGKLLGVASSSAGARRLIWEMVTEEMVSVEYN